MSKVLIRQSSERPILLNRAASGGTKVVSKFPCSGNQ